MYALQVYKPPVAFIVSSGLAYLICAGWSDPSNASSPEFFIGLLVGWLAGWLYFVCFSVSCIKNLFHTKFVDMFLICHVPEFSCLATVVRWLSSLSNIKLNMEFVQSPFTKVDSF
jgi:L-asparagine transporter-like permease